MSIETKQTVTVFESQEIRRYYNNETETWYFPLVDIEAALTDFVNATDYLKKLRKPYPDLNSYIGTNCPNVEMLTNGKKRKKLGRSEKWIQQRMTGQEMPLAFSNTIKINKYIHC